MRKIVKNIRKSIAIKRCARVLMAVSISLSTISMDAVISASAGNDNVILTSIGDGSENLALNKTAAASTNEGTAGRYPNAGVDGDINTRWASAAGVDGSGIDETWYQVDLGSETEVHKIVIVWESRPNKFQMQVSLDGKEWKDVGEVVDNGFYTSNPAKTNTVEFDTVNARYVRMQGIQRRRKTDEDGGASNRTGYSIKEFEIYGPAWDDSRYISEYLTTLNIKSRVSKNFTLPVKDDDYGITITWESDNDAITVSQDGKATVTRSENDVKALLTATVKRGEKSDTKKFEVTVVSNTGKEYEFSPIPQSVTYNSGYVLDNLSVFESLNANDDDSINDAMKVIEEGRRKLYSSNGSKQAAQKVIYPFVDELINILEAQVYDAIDLEYPRVAYGSFNTDYAKATDGNLATSASLGQYSSNDYFGINLGNITEVHTINITMPETNGSKKGYFKKGVLEYSVDNQHWTKINEYDSAVIHAEVENINARYIRYRALDTWENEVTGENISDILLNEMSVNQGLDYHDYSSCDTSLILTKNNNVLRLASNESFTLKSQEYVGVRFDVLKNVQIIKSQDTNLTVEVSNDGVKWTKQNWNTLNNFEIRLPQSHWL